ncbi:MAG: N-acetylmuramoyl-L-alanine amidase [Firmicutes bacterium]|nr:N-acetylmuramoyl-L-alanine amidase [Bacillota bacterium]
MATIVVDAGHGGTDFGATRDGRMEKADVLGMAVAVGRELERRGHRVIYTRVSDVFIPLTERARIANNAGANLFVSVHRDAFTNTTANGSSVFVRPNVSAATNACATQMASRMATAGNFANRGVHNGNFTVLTATNMPALLLEVGFISNPQDNTRYDTNFIRIANAIADGVEACLTGGVAPPPPPTSGAGILGRVTTTGGGLNLRSAPNTSAPIVTTMLNGSNVTILGEQNGFYRVSFQGREGYASTQFITPTPTQGTITTAGGNLNVRSAPSPTASILGTLPNGSRVTIQDIRGDFFQINFNGRPGFVSRSFVRI